MMEVNAHECTSDEEKGPARRFIQTFLVLCRINILNSCTNLNSWVPHPVARVSLSSSSTVCNSSLCYALYYTIHTTCFGLVYRPSSGRDLRVQAQYIKELLTSTDPLIQSYYFYAL
jgi:hypothetical protein